ncbi:MAG: YfcE family phosphodiesterase [Anaerolineae bacterium]|nr:YfcE family phosphodiesterase [Anaerolineae bacterium]
MNIGVMSDTHNDEQTTKKILWELRNYQSNTVIHCGDLTSPGMVDLFETFQVYLSFGNGDYLSGEISERLIHQAMGSKASQVLSLVLNDIPIGIVHGHDQHQLSLMARSGRYRYIFTGHTHTARTAVIGNCRIINPGAAHARGYHTPTFGLFDLETGEYFQHKLSGQVL